jgi:hypothetical protein
MNKDVKLTVEEKNQASCGLQMWANWIETGDVILSATDAENMGKKVLALKVEQMKTVIELRELADKILRLPTQY